jgi:hypothetical protein
MRSHLPIRQKHFSVWRSCLSRRIFDQIQESVRSYITFLDMIGWAKKQYHATVPLRPLTWMGPQQILTKVKHSACP